MVPPTKDVWKVLEAKYRKGRTVRSLHYRSPSANSPAHHLQGWSQGSLFRLRIDVPWCVVSSPIGDSIMSSGPLAFVPAKLSDQRSAVPERQLQRQRRRQTNVGDAERGASLLAGGALTIIGLQRRSLPGLLL